MELYSGCIHVLPGGCVEELSPTAARHTALHPPSSCSPLVYSRSQIRGSVSFYISKGSSGTLCSDITQYVIVRPHLDVLSFIMEYGMRFSIKRSLKKRFNALGCWEISYPGGLPYQEYKAACRKF